jgi:hypothetical protein
LNTKQWTTGKHSFREKEQNIVMVYVGTSEEVESDFNPKKNITLTIHYY